ncbi:hypothetical protein [Cupriavidus pampae]|uniref:Uncharacterized protein n=1 Tax=Cupriavidus pampae TaxID=659251 RepID=A0ABN7ZK49_9BURK|nr:hypothetical protein [Cupriavidus pampae]CAG9185883.1 hypothetical protein LMG32289_06142 [Cupriavidus pampae]
MSIGFTANTITSGLNDQHHLHGIKNSSLSAKEGVALALSFFLPVVGQLLFVAYKAYDRNQQRDAMADFSKALIREIQHVKPNAQSCSIQVNGEPVEILEVEGSDSTIGLKFSYCGQDAFQPAMSLKGLTLKIAEDMLHGPGDYGASKQDIAWTCATIFSAPAMFPEAVKDAANDALCSLLSERSGIFRLKHVPRITNPAEAQIVARLVGQCLATCEGADLSEISPMTIRNKILKAGNVSQLLVETFRGGDVEEPVELDRVFDAGLAAQDKQLLARLNGGNYDPKTLFGNIGYNHNNAYTAFHHAHPLVLYLIRDFSPASDTRDYVAGKSDEGMNQLAFDAALQSYAFFNANDVKISKVLTRFYTAHNQTLNISDHAQNRNCALLGR